MKFLLGLLRLIPGYGTALTFLSAFKGPCAILAIATALVAGGVSGTAMWKLKGRLDEGAIADARADKAKAQADLSAFQVTLATNAATAQAEGAARVLAAEQKAAARDAWIAAQLARIPDQVAAQLQPDLLTFRSSINANKPLADCLGLPLPASALGVLARPGGPIPATDH